MSRKTEDIYFDIVEGKSFNQIIEEEHIGYKDILLAIRSLIVNEKLKFNKYYYQDGDTKYKYTSGEIAPYNTINIDLNKDETEFKCIFTSDYHIGNYNDDLKLIDDVYDYAIKNNINNIFNTGDMIENVYAEKHYRLDNLNDQIDCVINEHPLDRRINNFILYGNHDYYSFTKENIDVGKIIENNRADLAFLGYGRGFIKLGNDYICLEHNIPNNNTPYLKDFSNIIFIGHSHKYKLDLDTKKEIYVPSLSGAYPSNYNYKPFKGFLDTTIYLDSKKVIKRILLKHFVITTSIDLVSEATIIPHRRTKLKDK